MPLCYAGNSIKGEPPGLRLSASQPVNGVRDVPSADIDAAIAAIQGSRAPFDAPNELLATAADAPDADDEFGYALEGGVRDAEFGRRAAHSCPTAAVRGLR